MTRLTPEPAAFRPALQVAARTLRAGGVIAYPTEGVYGLGCLADDVSAITRVLRIKHRSWRKGLAVIAADLTQLEALVELPSDGLRAEILASWPGPVTWVLRARPRVPTLVTGGRGTVAARITAHELARTLCRKAGGPLVSTSANRSTQPPLLTARAVRRALGGELDDVLAGPLGGHDGPTAIRDGRTGAYLRGG